MSKDIQGMRFRDMVDFNTAMLTKTAWRLQNEHESIWTRVIKGLYYPRGELMEAKKGVRPSWAWASLNTGRDMLKEHGVWRVGKGNIIRALKDAWISGISGHRLRLEGRTEVNENLTVEQLIQLNERKWELSDLQHVTTEEERMVIRSIHLCHTPGEDRSTSQTQLTGWPNRSRCTINYVNKLGKETLMVNRSEANK